MKQVTLCFEGTHAEEAAEKFFHYLVDGGLEDKLIDVLSDDGVQIEGFSKIDTENLSVSFECE